MVPKFPEPKGPGARTPEEVGEILVELARVRDRPPPDDPAAGGCVVAIVALVALVLMPFVGRAFSLSGRAMLSLGLLLVGISLIGALVGFFGDRLLGRGVVSDATEAIGELLAEYPGGDPRRLRRAAIRILEGAFVTHGPTTVPGFDFVQARERLGDALPYVEHIERVLLEQREIRPVFTTIRESGASEVQPS